MKLSQNFNVKLFSASFSVSGIKYSLAVNDELETQDLEYYIEHQKSNESLNSNKTPLIVHKKRNRFSTGKVLNLKTFEIEDLQKLKSVKIKNKAQNEDNKEVNKSNVIYCTPEFQDFWLSKPELVQTNYAQASSIDSDNKPKFEELKYYDTKILEDKFNRENFQQFYNSEGWSTDLQYDQILQITTNATINKLNDIKNSTKQLALSMEFNYEILKYNSFENEYDLVFFRKRQNEFNLFKHEFKTNNCLLPENNERRIYQMLIRQKNYIQSGFLT